MYNNQQYNPLGVQPMGGMQTPNYQPQAQQQASAQPNFKMPDPVMPSYTANPYLSGQINQGLPQFGWMQQYMNSMGGQGGQPGVAPGAPSGSGNGLLGGWGWSGTQNGANPVQKSFKPGENNPNLTDASPKAGKDQYYYDANGVMHAPNGMTYNATNGNRALLEAQLGLNKVDGTDFFAKDDTQDMYGWDNGKGKGYSIRGADGQTYLAPTQGAANRIMQAAGGAMNAQGRWDSSVANPFAGGPQSTLNATMGAFNQMFGGNFSSSKDVQAFMKNKANLGLLPDKKTDPQGYADMQGMLKFAQQQEKSIAQANKKVKK